MRLSIGSIIALLLAPLAAATTRKVPADFPTIQAAINASVDGDTVLVSTGTYGERIDFVGKDITVTSVGGPSVTTIDGGGHGSVVTFKNGETLAAVLSGFTVKGGTGTQDGYETSGGGIFCSGASPTIKLNVITGNTARGTIVGGGLGGGIYANNGSPAISQNTISSNTAGNGDPYGWRAGSGGGIACSGDAVITRNVIIRNSVSGNGGGIACASGAARITSNLIVSNVATSWTFPKGGGLDCSGAAPILTNNTFALNVVDYGAGGAISASGSTVITNCIFWDDDSGYEDPEIYGSPTVTYSDVQGGFAGTGNIKEDPQFANKASDFHLLPNSPCLNAGNDAAPGLPASDFEGDARIHYNRVDIGGDEITSCVVLFEPFGVGIAGSGGFVPWLDGTEGSCDAGGHVVHIGHGLGGAMGNLWIGLTTGDLPFYGGHFYVGLGGPWTTVPIKLKGLAGVPGTGFLDIPGSDVNVFPGLVVTMQVSLADPGAIRHVALSPGCKVTIGE